MFVSIQVEARSRLTTQAQRLRRRGAPAAERRLGAKAEGAAGVTRRSSSLQRIVRRYVWEVNAWSLAAKETIQIGVKRGIHAVQRQV